MDKEGKNTLVDLTGFYFSPVPNFGLNGMSEIIFSAKTTCLIPKA